MIKIKVNNMHKNLHVRVTKSKQSCRFYYTIRNVRRKKFKNENLQYVCLVLKIVLLYLSKYESDGQKEFSSETLRENN